MKKKEGLKKDGRKKYERGTLDKDVNEDLRLLQTRKTKLR